MFSVYKDRLTDPNVDVREQGDSAVKYLAQEQYKGFFTILGDHISNLHQRSHISLLAHVAEQKSKYLE